MTRYYAVAPVFTSYVDEAATPLPVDLGNGVHLDRVPEVFSKHHAAIAKEMGEWHTNAGRLALVAEFEAAYQDEADPLPPGRPRTKSAAARQAVQLAALSLWLAQPTDLSFCLIALLSETTTPRPIVFPVLCVVEGFPFSVLTLQDVAEARTINGLLSGTSTRTTAFVAARYLWLALHEDAADLAYGILSIAIEALFGPDDGKGDLTHRIPRRVAALFGGSRAEQCLAHVRATIWWRVRCEVMHGDTLEDHSDTEKTKLLTEALEIVRLGIRKALLDPTVAAAFSNFTTRDAYLESVGRGFVDPSPGEQAASEAAR